MEIITAQFHIFDKQRNAWTPKIFIDAHAEEGENELILAKAHAERVQLEAEGHAVEYPSE